MKVSKMVVAAVLGLALAGCATADQSRENMLVAAGFRIRLADTPEKVASLKAFPPHQFFAQNQNGQPTFFYADPTVCGCLYYGTMDNLQAYQQMVFRQKLADEQQMTAMMNQNTAFDFGPWGPPFW
ncbi:hypothetical protein MWN34_19480 [Ancylobacter sp. 6x-1]|uniref:Uncharacterized protein n=1 Tax=Ancylobacter crimeensis TaxID=2579147 RepID=A0ABT0DGR9_9HYPH|nr:hypothetical protein [Ancylobacter crimeensis]MCK0199084.1 hypothetical protein [Ancylobacter crimeensis]